jgi:rhodanese-related sulfurtransferase
VPSWLTNLFGQAKPGPAWIEQAELRRAIGREDRPMVIDVRGPDEFDGPLGHIDGAVNIPLPDLAEHTTGLADAGSAIVVVCLTDKRSAAAAVQLAEAGIRGVTVLRGGMKAWRGE